MRSSQKEETAQKCLFRRGNYFLHDHWQWPSDFFYCIWKTSEILHISCWKAFEAFTGKGLICASLIVYHGHHKGSNRDSPHRKTRKRHFKFSCCFPSLFLFLCGSPNHGKKLAASFTSIWHSNLWSHAELDAFCQIVLNFSSAIGVVILFLHVYSLVCINCVLHQWRGCAQSWRNDHFLCCTFLPFSFDVCVLCARPEK